MRRRFKQILRHGMYRSRDGVILGVCRGIAEYFDFSVFWVRGITVLFFLISGFWPLAVIYFIAALLMKPAPAIPIHTNEEQEFYNSYVHSRKGAADRIKRRYRNIESRIQRLEDTVTTREFDWEHRMNT